MKRPLKIIRNIAIGVAATSLVIAVAGVIIVQTDWFRNYVREKIVQSTESSLGGKVEVGSFRFDWRHLQAVVTDYVIHGTEPAGAAPFLRAERVQVNIRLLPSLHHWLDVSYLGVEKPEVNVIVSASGQTNIPTPPKKAESTDPPLAPVVNLAVGHFDLSNGHISFASQKQDLNVHGTNLNVQLWFDMLQRGYNGTLAFEPVYVVSGRNTPVKFAIRLPVTLKGDRVDFKQATIKTSDTNLVVDGSVENLRNPKVAAHIYGHVGLADLKNVGDVPISIDARNVPSAVDLDANATIGDDKITVAGLRLGIGHSNIEASGTLKDPKGNGSLEFKSSLAMGEIGRLLNLAARPEGTAVLNGNAKLDAANNYQVDGNLLAKGLSFTQGADRISNINLYTAVHADPHSLDLKGLRLSAFGGQFFGDASMEDFARYRLHGNLRNLDLRAAAAAFGQKDLAYDGVVSGPVDAAGNLKDTPAAKGLTAQVRLTIAPGRKGVPVSGRLFAKYNGATDRLEVENSYIALPHTRLTLNGSVNNQLNVVLTTSDVADLLAAISSTGKAPVDLHDRQASFNGAVTGSLSSPKISGHLAANGFSVEGRLFDSLVADVTASSTAASVRNGSLRRGPMQTDFSADVGLANWKATPNQPLSANATIQNGDLADIMALAGQPSTDYSGALSAKMQVGGTVGNPRGSANILASNGTIQGESFDRIQAQVNLDDQRITIPSGSIEAGAARVNLTADYQHPKDSLTTARLHAHVQTNSVDLAQLHRLQTERPNTGGQVQLNADVTGELSNVKKDGKEQTEFLLTSVNGDASAHGLQLDGQNYGDASLTAKTNAQTVTYSVASDFAGSNVQVKGSTKLTRGYPTTADASLKNLPIERLLAAARRTDIPAKGNLSGSAHVTGTLDNPQGNADLELANAVLYDEPIDHLRLRASYEPRWIDVPQLEIVSGPSRIDLAAKFDHPEGNLQAGHIQFRVNSSKLDLTRIKNLQSRRPGLGGTLELAANGEATVQEGEPRFKLRDLTANVAAHNVAMHGKSYGDLTLAANTTGGKLNFTLDSNLASASIRGKGTADLADTYPIDAQLTFSNVAWTKFQGLLGSPASGPPSFDVVTDGQVSVKGPALKPEELRGSIDLSRLLVSSIPAPNRKEKAVTLQNQGPIRASLDRKVVKVESAHLTGPQTDLQATGTVSLASQSMDLTLNANANLAILQNLSRDITSSGNVVLATTLHGTFDSPLINGHLEVKNASFNYADIPNGIANANGVVTFNGTSAAVQNMTAESGGGKVTLAGFVAFRDELRYGLRADSTSVRVRPQPGLSVVLDSNIRLTGTSENSILSGTATIQRITYAPQADMGSLLSRAAPPIQAPGTPSPISENMKLDIRIRTTSATSVQSSLAENLQTQADLRVRGTLARPGVLGRITISEGQLAFFGTTYTVNNGTIGFYDPLRIAPVLDVNLETKAKGVDVTLRVTGPIDDMKLSYTSDPPLQFQEIVSLLASGKAPTSDPTLLANQPSTPPQSFQQMGESALVSKALADPVANRLQRVFGVSQLKIDPTFTSGSDLPQANLTLQQQVTSNITFTYITALNNPNSQTIRVEWALNPQWSAVASRDENGLFSVNFLYKRQLR